MIINTASIGRDFWAIGAEIRLTQIEPMIKFFRKIRYDLMEKNPTSAKATASSKTGKPAFALGTYLKYAFGEIILVVIGILIALQINQWNENRKETSALQILTRNLNKEFRTNYKELESDINRLNRKVVAGNIVLSYSGIQALAIPESKIDSLIFEAIEIPTWNPSSFVLNDIKNSGKLSTLKSEKLKQLLYEWDRLYEDILEWHTSFNTSASSLAAIIIKKGSLVNIDFYKKDSKERSRFKIGNKGLLLEIQFENELENNLFAARELVERYHKAQELLNKIIEESKSKDAENI